MNNAPTPRTDAMQKWLFSINGQMQTVCVHVEDARQLERELAEALSLKDDAMKHLQPVLDNNDKLQGLLTTAEQDRDRWRKMAEELAAYLQGFHPYDENIDDEYCKYCNALSRFNAMKGEKE